MLETIEDVQNSADNMGDGRTEKITFTCTPDTKEYLIAWAEEEDRKVSNLVDRIINQAIQEHQRQKETPPSTRTRKVKGE
ncbi:hypothetical protein [Trichocoleus sp. DQ-U1]|uniref:hypothetical protein n=1 Tax=Trichocoleus sp. DQ-U1 TaxID=2933926 RepID=UPI003299F772